MIRMNLSDISSVFIGLFFLLFQSSANAELYKVTVNQEEQNLYKIIGTDMYIKTNLCYTITHYGTAILDISSLTSGAIGRVIFVDENRAECLVVKLLKEIPGVR